MTPERRNQLHGRPPRPRSKNFTVSQEHLQEALTYAARYFRANGGNPYDEFLGKLKELVGRR